MIITKKQIIELFLSDASEETIDVDYIEFLKNAMRNKVNKMSACELIENVKRQWDWNLSIYIIRDNTFILSV